MPFSILNSQFSIKKVSLLLLNIFCLLTFSSAAVYDNLYLTGNATSVGWTTSGIPLAKESTGVFTWTGPLKGKVSGEDNGNVRFKFIVGNNWSPSITCRVNINGHLLVKSGEEADIYVFTGDGYDNAFQVDSTGTYSIRVNLNTMKIVCTKLSVEPGLEQYTKETFVTSGSAVLNYRKLTPLTPEKDTKYPLIIFLHGAGERGSDNSNQLTHGGDLFAKTENRKAFPAYVLFPQCPSNYFWPFNSQPASYTATTFPVDYAIAPAIQQVKELIDSYLKMDEIDKDRIYITGISMGGMGTFDMVCRFPEIFAAAVPICGGINVERLNSNVKNIYWRIFHGGSDGVVTVNNSRTAYAKLKEIGASVEYIEFPGVDHDSWVPAFKQEDYLSWIFSKVRKSNSGINTIKETQSSKIYHYNNKLYIESEESGALQVNMYSVSGVLVHTFRDINESDCLSKEYTLPLLDKGIYFIEVKKNNNCSLLKIYI